MKLYSKRKLRGYAPFMYMEHNYVDGRQMVTCYHYDVANVSMVIEAWKQGANAVDVSAKGAGCKR